MQNSQQVTVAVLTFHRPEPLARLLDLLKDETTGDRGDASPGRQFRVLVVDNDPEGSAGPVVRRWNAANQPCVDYVVEARPGISAARNRALDESAGAEALVFIDDDETPQPGWLSSLLRTHTTTGAALVTGPVVSSFDGVLDPWVAAGRFFDRDHHRDRPDGSSLPRAASNNLLLHLPTVLRHGIRFDDEYGLTGGEDSLFTGELVARGETIRWSAGAVVNDHVPVARLTREYAVKRTYDLANSSIRVEIALAGANVRNRTRLRAASIATARVALGSFSTVVGRVSGSLPLEARGSRTTARGRGALAAALGRHRQAYGDEPREPESGAVPLGAVLVAHPSSDLYGSDLQLVETVRGLRESGREVKVLLPEEGPLNAQFTALGATVSLVPSPVLRKSLMTPRGLTQFGVAFIRSIVDHHRLLRRDRPAALLVNTVTIPAWLVAARLAGVPVVCHVHEAEADQPRAVRVALAAPLLLAQRVVTNSKASSEVVTRAIPRLAGRIALTYNGIAGSPHPTPPPRRDVSDPVEIVLVGRLSPRKGSDVALEAVARVRSEGVDARLTLCGSAFAGYEWFEDQLRARGAMQDLADAVELRGYVADPAAALAKADIVLVPSRVEPFGNAAVEALLARRPLVASATQGLREIVRDGDTGLLVPPDDAVALAAAILRLARDPDLAAAMAERGRTDAVTRFSVERYRRDMASHVDAVVADAASRGLTRGSSR